MALQSFMISILMLANFPLFSFEVILQRQIQKLKLSSITIDSDDISSDEDSLSLISADADIFELKNSDSCDSKENVGEGWIGHSTFYFH